MLILNIIPAQFPKRAVLYDAKNKQLIFETADVIGLVELQNPDDLEEVTVVPMYMTSNTLGVYSLPQLAINFLEIIPLNETVDYSTYLKQIKDIETLLKNLPNKDEVVEVETKGNISRIKRIIKNVTSEKPTDENK